MTAANRLMAAPTTVAFPLLLRCRVPETHVVVVTAEWAGQLDPHGINRRGESLEPPPAPAAKDRNVLKAALAGEEVLARAAAG